MFVRPACTDDTFWVCPLVRPFSLLPGQGFYVELFLIDAFPSERLSKRKRVSSWCFQWNDIQLDTLLHNFRGYLNIHHFLHFQFHKFYPINVGKGGAFHGFLSLYKSLGLEIMFYRSLGLVSSLETILDFSRSWWLEICPIDAAETKMAQKAVEGMLI